MSTPAQAHVAELSTSPGLELSVAVISRDPTVLQTGDEIRLCIEPGGFVEVRGFADSKALRRQLATALAASVLLEGRLVLIIDWLPGLHWRVRASQQFADLLPSVTVDAIWNAVNPHLTRWLDEPADAEVFVLSREWGECALVPSVYRCETEQVAFAFRCHWATRAGGWA